MADYAIVEFVASSSVAVIPVCWFIDEEESCCYWPNTAKSNVIKLVKCKQDADRHWKSYKVRVLGKAKTYDRACEKVIVAEDTSDLQTDAETSQDPPPKRRRQIPRRLMESEPESSDSESPPDYDPSIVEEPVPEPPRMTEACATPLSEPPRMRSTQTTVNQPSTISERTFLVGESVINKILRNQEEIKEDLKINRALLQSVRRSTQITEDVSPPADMRFPINTMEEFTEVDNKLDSSNQNKLVNLLGDLGGRTLDECVRRIMNYIMTNPLSMCFNMVGRNGKGAFGATKMFDVVYRSVKRNKLSDVNKKDIERSVSKWFLAGRDRDGNRAIRRARTERTVTDGPIAAP